MSTKDLEAQVYDLLGGEEGIEDLMAESIRDKLDDDGMLVYVPPITPLKRLGEEDIDAIASMDTVNMFRYIYSDLRTTVRNMFDEIFSEMKTNPDVSIKLNKEYIPEVSEEDIDEVVMAMLNRVNHE